MKNLYLLITLLAISIPAVNAQTCTEKLQTAQRNFDDGLLEGIPDLISGCMGNGFTDEEMANAYKLLIQTYIYSEDIQKADETMLIFLRDFPSYSIADNDPKEFIDLYNTYNTTPVFNIETSAGLSLSIPFITENNSPVDINTDPEQYYAGTGFAFEMNYLNELSKKLNYGIGISFLYSSMGYYSEPFNYTVLEATFWDMMIGIPISVRYDLPVLNRLEVYGKIGFEPSFLVRSRMDFIRTDNIRPEPFSGNEDLTKLKNRIDVRPFLGVGVNYDIGRDFLTFSLNYKTGTVKTLNNGMTYTNLDDANKYIYFEDERINNNLIFLLSYIRPIYNPQKMQER